MNMISNMKIIALLCMLVSAFVATLTPPHNVPRLVPRQAKDANYTDDNLFQTNILAWQNWFRAQHSANPLTWNNKIAASAATWANDCSTYGTHSVSHFTLTEKPDRGQNKIKTHITSVRM